ncbi:hypothetical protein R6Z07F_012565 [Ovis aries]
MLEYLAADIPGAPGQYLSVICSVPGRYLVLSSCGTVAQQERTAQTHPRRGDQVASRLLIQGFLTVSEEAAWCTGVPARCPILSGDSWPRRVHCVQRRHGSCRVKSILDCTVLEMLA